jgi:hypothetical protein
MDYIRSDARKGGSCEAISTLTGVLDALGYGETSSGYCNVRVRGRY